MLIDLSSTEQFVGGQKMANLEENQLNNTHNFYVFTLLGVVYQVIKEIDMYISKQEFQG